METTVAKFFRQWISSALKNFFFFLNKWLLSLRVFSYPKLEFGCKIHRPRWSKIIASAEDIQLTIQQKQYLKILVFIVFSFVDASGCYVSHFSRQFNVSFPSHFCITELRHLGNLHCPQLLFGFSETPFWGDWGGRKNFRAIPYSRYFSCVSNQQG